jgi:hypothetical protein
MDMGKQDAREGMLFSFNVLQASKIVKV